MRKFAISLSRYSRTVPARLLTSILIFAILTQLYWIALTLRLTGVFNPKWRGDTTAQLDVFAAQAASHEFATLLVLAVLALMIAGFFGECQFILGAVMIGVCLLGYFATVIPLPASPFATHLSPSLTEHLSNSISHHLNALFAADLIAAWPLYNACRYAIKRAGYKARLPKDIEDIDYGSSLFVALDIRRKYAASIAIFLTLAACLSLLILMRSTLGALQPQHYTGSDSASTWLICVLFLLLASCYVPWLDRTESRQVLSLFLLGAPVLALWPKVISFPVPGQFPAGPNAFWIGVVAYPLAAAIGYVSLRGILKWNTAA
jgi:hypothetical protein